MRIQEIRFAGRQYNDKQSCSTILELAKELPVYSMHTEYNIDSVPSCWFTFQGVSISVSATFIDYNEMISFMQTLDWSKKTTAKRHEEIFSKISEKLLDTVVP